jgi:hypothetical protein
MQRQFDGTREIGDAPRHFNGKHVFSQVKDLPAAHGKKGRTLGKRKCNKGDDLKESGKRSQFYGSYLTRKT